jgi:hypothetical protein
VFVDPKTKNKPGRRPGPTPDQLEAFARWYQIYPRHEARADGLKAWCELSPDSDLVETIMSATAGYASAHAETERKHIKMPGPWLRGRRWEDEIAKPEPVAKRSFVNAPG